MGELAADLYFTAQGVFWLVYSFLRLSSKQIIVSLVLTVLSFLKIITLKFKDPRKKIIDQFFFLVMVSLYLVLCADKSFNLNTNNQTLLGVTLVITQIERLKLIKKQVIPMMITYFSALFIFIDILGQSFADIFSIVGSLFQVLTFACFSLKYFNPFENSEYQTQSSKLMMGFEQRMGGPPVVNRENIPYIASNLGTIEKEENQERQKLFKQASYKNVRDRFFENKNGSDTQKIDQDQARHESIRLEPSYQSIGLSHLESYRPSGPSDNVIGAKPVNVNFRATTKGFINEEGVQHNPQDQQGGDVKFLFGFPSVKSDYMERSSKGISSLKGSLQNNQVQVNQLPIILNMVNQPIVVLDEKHQLLYQNRKATKIFNTENSDLIIKELRKIFSKPISLIQEESKLQKSPSSVSIQSINHQGLEKLIQSHHHSELFSLLLSTSTPDKSIDFQDYDSLTNFVRFRKMYFSNRLNHFITLQVQLIKGKQDGSLGFTESKQQLQADKFQQLKQSQTNRKQQKYFVILIKVVQKRKKTKNIQSVVLKEQDLFHNYLNECSNCLESMDVFLESYKDNKKQQDLMRGKIGLFTYQTSTIRDYLLLSKGNLFTKIRRFTIQTFLTKLQSAVNQGENELFQIMTKVSEETLSEVIINDLMMLIQVLMTLINHLVSHPRYERIFTIVINKISQESKESSSDYFQFTLKARHADNQTPTKSQSTLLEYDSVPCSKLIDSLSTNQKRGLQVVSDEFNSDFCFQVENLQPEQLDQISEKIEESQQEVHQSDFEEIELELQGLSRVPMIFQARQQQCSCKSIIIMEKDPQILGEVLHSIKLYHPTIDVEEVSAFDDLRDLVKACDQRTCSMKWVFVNCDEREQITEVNSFINKFQISKMFRQSRHNFAQPTLIVYSKIENNNIPLELQEYQKAIQVTLPLTTWQVRAIFEEISPKFGGK